MIHQRICLFSSYFNEPQVPYYVLFYLKNLIPHFDKIVFITNGKEKSEWKVAIAELGIEIMEVQNEGYDFGMWYKAMLKYNVHEYGEMALVNDSCILFKSLEDDIKRSRKSSADYVGMVITDRIAPHVQSYFLIVKNGAVKLTYEYFLRNAVIGEYREVIRVYEIGLSQHLQKNGISVAGLYNETHRDWPKNPSFSRIEELIEEGIPMIKKKIMFRNYRGLEFYWVVRMNFNTNYRRYIKLIQRKYANESLVDFNEVMKDCPRKGRLDIVLMEIARFFANLLRMIPGVTWMFRGMVRFYKSIQGASS